MQNSKKKDILKDYCFVKIFYVEDDSWKVKNDLMVLLKENSPCYNNHCLVNVICIRKGSYDCPLVKEAVESFGFLFNRADFSDGKKNE